MEKCSWCNCQNQIFFTSYGGLVLAARQTPAQPLSPSPQHDGGENKMQQLLDCVGVTRAAERYLLHRGVSMGRRGVSAVVPAAPPGPPFLWPARSQGCFSHFFSSLQCAAFCPFLNMFSQRCRQLRWRAQLCAAVGAWRSQLGPTGTSHVWHWAAPSLPHGDSCRPCCRHLHTGIRYTNPDKKKRFNDSLKSSKVILKLI